MGAPLTVRAEPAEEEEPPTVGVERPEGGAPTRGLTRAPVTPSLVETRRISDGLPDAVMLGR